jgi:UDP-glucose 4-epimerase
VREVLDVVDDVTGEKLDRELLDRRAGDPAVLVADSSRLRAELGWKPEFTELSDIVASAWAWHRNHPNGY